MTRYTPQQRAEIVTIFIQQNESIVLTQREYKKRHKNNPVPDKKTIRVLASKFKLNGTTFNCHRSGRPRTARSEENITRVSQSVVESPQTSIRRRGQQLNISSRSLQRILKKNLHLFPYKILLVQKLLLRDHNQRLEYSNAIVNLQKKFDNFSEKIMMSDEAHFYLSGHVNKQNYRFWASENPRVFHETPLHPQKVTVWCCIHAKNVVGPYFFENENGQTTTVTGENYRQMIRDFLMPQIVNQGLHNMWFQQDGATAHTSKETIRILKVLFPGRLISRFGDLQWPARSPDLTAPDFFLWGYLKEKVYINNPQTIDQLKNNIRQEIENIPVKMFKQVMDNSIKRAHLCKASEGRHLADIIF